MPKNKGLDTTLIQLLSWFSTNKHKVSYYFSQVLRYWCPPPATILDLTAGLGATTKELYNSDLDGKRYKIIKFDISSLANLDILSDLKNLPIKANIADIVYLDPPYNKTSHRRRTSTSTMALQEKRRHLKQYISGFEDLQNILSNIGIVANRILKPNGCLIIKIQDRYKLPHVIPQTFKLLGYLEPYGFVLHDYIIYVYSPSFPPLPAFTDAKLTFRGHGFFICFTKRSEK